MSEKPLSLLRALIMTLSLVGCSIPAPTVREFNAESSLSQDSVCMGEIKTARFKERGEAAISGVLECDTAEAKIVLFNSFQVRVRTITVGKTGAVRDEITYLSPSKEDAETVVTALQRALLGGALGDGEPHFEILHVTKRIPPATP